MREVGKLLKDMYTKEEYFNSSDIYLLLSYLVKENNLDDYINDVVINIYESKCNGKYIPKTKRLYIYPNSIFLSSNYPIDYINDYKRAMHFYNLSLLLTIIHELEHAIQCKTANESTNNTLGFIIRENMEFGKNIPDNITNYEKFLYTFFYNSILFERNADILSYIYILKENKNYSFLNNNEKDFLEEKLINKINYNYSKHSSPSLKYFNLRQKRKIFNDLDFSLKYDYITTLSWGLPIDDVTLVSLKDKKKTLQKLI